MCVLTAALCFRNLAHVKQRQAQSVQTLLYVEADRIMGVLRAAERFRIRT